MRAPFLGKLLGWFLGTILVDQLSKYLAQRFAFLVVFNQGVSFGLGQDFEMFSTMIWVVVAVGAMIWFLKDFWMKHPAAAGLFFGAVTSNILDRFLYGAVVDWIPIPVFNLHNNLADIVIVGVTGYFLITDLLQKFDKRNNS